MARLLTVPGRYDQLEPICKFVTQAAHDAGLNEVETGHCQLAVDEACTNVIEHGYRGEDRGPISVQCDVAPGELVITILDRAARFDPTQVAEPNTRVPLEELPVGGLGLFLMRRVMDAVEFSYEDGGNKLVLIKRKA